MFMGSYMWGYTSSDMWVISIVAVLLTPLLTTHPLLTEYTFNHIRDPTIFSGIFFNQGYWKVRVRVFCRGLDNYLYFFFFWGGVPLYILYLKYNGPQLKTLF